MKPNGPGIKALYTAHRHFLSYFPAHFPKGKNFRKPLGFGPWPQISLLLLREIEKQTRCCCSSKMSTPMEITLQNPPDPDISDQNAVASASASAPSPPPPPPPLPPVLADDRVSVSGTYMALIFTFHFCSNSKLRA